MTHVRVPVLLVAPAEAIVRPPTALAITNRVTPLDVISTRSRPDGAYRTAILEIRDSDRKELLECGIILRNAGVTAIVANCDTVPADLVISLDSQIKAILDELKTPKAELLFLGEALDAMLQMDEFQLLQ